MSKNLKKILVALLALIVLAVYPIYSKLSAPADVTDPSFTQESETVDPETIPAKSEEESAPPSETSPPESEKNTTEKSTAAKPATTKPTTTKSTTAKPTTTKPATTKKSGIDENGTYTSKDDVALYIHTYGHLPGNFITKKQAQALGWPGGSLEPYAPGKSIGGDYFGNYEGLLPTAKGRKYTECDIDTGGAKSRGAKRIIFSNDGLIFYTSDHYESFTQLY